MNWIKFHEKWHRNQCPKTKAQLQSIKNQLRLKKGHTRLYMPFTWTLQKDVTEECMCSKSETAILYPPASPTQPQRPSNLPTETLMKRTHYRVFSPLIMKPYDLEFMPQDTRYAPYSTMSTLTKLYEKFWLCSSDLMENVSFQVIFRSVHLTLTFQFSIITEKMGIIFTKKNWAK